MYFSRPHLCSIHISMVRMNAPRSTVNKYFWTPPPRILSLTEGEGGFGIDDKTHAHLDGSGLSTWIYDQYYISDPFVYSAFNGGGGSRMCDKQHAYICGQQASAQINGSKCFSDPPDWSIFNWGGGSRMESFLWRAPVYTWHRSTGPESHRLLRTDIPSSPPDVIIHLSRKSHIP